jgi:hypothetical protein
MALWMPASLNASMQLWRCRLYSVAADAARHIDQKGEFEPDERGRDGRGVGRAGEANDGGGNRHRDGQFLEFQDDLLGWCMRACQVECAWKYHPPRYIAHGCTQRGSFFSLKEKQVNTKFIVCVGILAVR